MIFVKHFAVIIASGVRLTIKALRKRRCTEDVGDILFL